MRDLIANTSAGLVLGSADAIPGCVSWFGIPFAAPPTGNQRWRPPQPPTPWEGVRDGSSDTHPSCLQTPTTGLFVDNWPWIDRLLVPLSERLLPRWRANHSEDCLTLNVQAPPPGRAGLSPVLFWIHGGSYLAGSGSDKPASELCAGAGAEEPVVFVSFNYRLGVFGALALPELLREGGTTGNYALQDIRRALEWVQQNIREFGGDPARVTIKGESAGAMAVAAHYASPLSAGLFSGAIMQSGNDDSLGLDEATSAGQRFARLVGCGGEAVVSCLRAADGWALVNVQNRVYNGTMRALQLPVADGYELARGARLRDVYERGELPPTNGSGARPPLLAGTNVDDISLFLGLTQPEIVRELEGDALVTRADLLKMLPRLVPNATADERARLLALYEPSSAAYRGDARRALYDLATDGYFACPTRRILRAVARMNSTGRSGGGEGGGGGGDGGGPGAFRYVFNGSFASPAATFGLPRWLWNVTDAYFAPWLGAFHGVDELFWSAAIDPSGPMAQRFSVAEAALARRVRDQWRHFAIHGRPLGSWPAYNTTKEAHRVFDTSGDHVGERWRAARCDFLERFRFVWNPPDGWWPPRAR